MLLLALLTTLNAAACPSEEAKAASADAAVAIPAEAAVHSAQRQDLISANCSFTTSVMARRIVEEGEPYSFLGTLELSENDLASRVAAPFLLDSEIETFVVANEVVEILVDSGQSEEPILLEGRVLEVDGVRYLVVTSYKVQTS